MSDVAESIRLIIDEQNQEFLERRDAILAVWLCLLSGQHGYLMGPAGTAKSSLLASVSARIDGSRYWHIQLDKMLDKSDSFGQYDIARFEREGTWERDYTDTFGDCHIALLDELDKSGPSSLVPYLDMLQDRRFKPGKHWVEAPLISAFGAANADIDSTDGTMAALADRFLVRVQVEYLIEPRNFLALLDSAIVPAASTAPATITLEQLEHVRRHEVATVTLPASVAQAVLDLRNALLEQGVVCSDRRWKNSVSVLQAHAWLAGRTEITDDDLSVLRFVLWSSAAQIGLVTAAVMAARSPQAQAVDACITLLDEIQRELAVRAGTPLGERVAWAGTATLKLNTAHERMVNLGLAECQHRIESLRVAVYAACLEGRGD